MEVREVGRYAAPQPLGARVDQPFRVVLAPLRLGVVDALRKGWIMASHSVAHRRTA